MAQQVDEELENFHGVRLSKSDPRVFANEYRLVAFALDEVYALDSAVSEFVRISYPIHHGFYGADINHMDMFATGVLGWRVPVLRAETALVKYDAGKTWSGRSKIAFALFVSDHESCYLAAKDMSLEAATPMIVRGLRALAS